MKANTGTGVDTGTGTDTGTNTSAATLVAENKLMECYGFEFLVANIAERFARGAAAPRAPRSAPLLSLGAPQVAVRLALRLRRFFN